MSRYRVKDYRIELLPSSSAVLLFFNKPAGLKYDFAAATAAAAKDYLAQSLRVAIDETANVALCHSMGKERFAGGGLATGVHQAESQYDLVIALLIPNFNVLTSSSSDTTHIAYRTEPDATGSYENKEIKVTDAITLEFDFGDEPTAVMPAIETAQENIMGGKVPVNTGESIPAIDIDEEMDLNGEGEVNNLANKIIVKDFGIGTVVKACDMTVQTEDTCYVAKAVNNPGLSYDGQDFYVSGVTLMVVEKDKAYICTNIIQLTYTADGENNPIPYSGETVTNAKLFVYAEYDPGVSTKELRSIIGAQTSEVKKEMRNVAGICRIADIEDSCLPFEASNGFCAVYGDGDFDWGDFNPESEHYGSYAVGSIIKVIGNNGSQELWNGYPEGSELAVASEVATPSTGPGEESGLYQDDEGHMHGITKHIVWEKGHYYRVTGIVECYSEYEHTTISIFTYEEVDPATITELVEKAMKVLQSEYRQSAGSMIPATSAEYAAFKTHMQSEIASILTPIN